MWHNSCHWQPPCDVDQPGEQGLPGANVHLPSIQQVARRGRKAPAGTALNRVWLFAHGWWCGIYPPGQAASVRLSHTGHRTGHIQPACSPGTVLATWDGPEALSHAKGIGSFKKGITMSSLSFSTCFSYLLSLAASILFYFHSIPLQIERNCCLKSFRDA